MGKLARKISKRLMAAALTVAMVMSNMTVYAGELNMPQAEVQSEITADIDTDADNAAVDVTGDTPEMPEDGTTPEDGSETDEVTDGTVGDGEESGEGTGEEGGDASNPDDEFGSDEEGLDAEEGEEPEELEESIEDVDILEEAEKPVEDTASGNKSETIVHYLDTTTLSALVSKDDEQLPDGTTFADGFFQIVEKVTQRFKDKDVTKATDCLQIYNRGNGAIKFTVTGTAVLEISARSTSNDKTSYIVLSDEGEQYKVDPTKFNAEKIQEDNKVETVSSKASLKWTGLGAGTYVLYSNGTNKDYTNLQVYSIKVTETIVERGPWDSVAAPSITGVAEDAAERGKINVTVSADIGDNGGDKLEVKMYKGTEASGAPIDMQYTKDKKTEHTLSFSPAESGTYCFVADLSRANETSKTSSVSTPITITVPLATPQNLGVTETIGEEGSIDYVTFTWSEVKEADHYKVLVTAEDAAQGAAPVYQKDNINKKDKAITIMAADAVFENGKTYIFSLTAVRPGTGADGGIEEVTATTAKKMAASGERTKTYVFNPATMEDVSYMKAAKGGGPAHGTQLGTDRYFSIGIYNSGGYVNPSGQYVQVRRDVKAGIEFTIQGKANVLVEAASTGANNNTPISIYKITKPSSAAEKAPTFDNTPMEEKDGKGSVSGDKVPNALTWIGLDAGTYSVVSPAVGGTSDLRVFSITVKETSGRADRTSLSFASKPTVESAVNNNGVLSVDVANAPVGNEGGDRMVVVLEDSNGNEVSGVRGASGMEGNTHNVSVNLDSCETGNYTVRAKLVRGVGSDREELPGEVTKSISYRAQIKDPTGLYTENAGRTEAGSGSVMLSWNRAAGAQYYIIQVIDSTNNVTEIITDDNCREYTVNEGLTIGGKYTFKVYAASKLNGEEARSANAAVVNNYEIIDGVGDAPLGQGQYVLKINDIGVFAASTKQDGERQRVGTSNFFTMIYNSSSKIEKESQTFPDSTSESGKLSFNSSARTIGGSIRFATTGPARVTVYWKAGADGREIKIVDGNDEEVKSTNIGTAKDAAYVSKLYLNEAGTYYLGNKGGNNYIYKVIVDNECTIIERPEWNTVSDPEILDVKQDKGNVLIKVKAKIGSEGVNAEADKVEVIMYDEAGDVAGVAQSVKEGDVDPTLTITPAASGKYKFKAVLSRDYLDGMKTDENDAKVSHYPTEGGEPLQFWLPLEIPKLEKDNVQNKGAVDEAKQYGSVELSWGSVKEADRYIVKVSGKDTAYEDEQIVTVPALLINATGEKGLLVGKTYNFSVIAQRDVTGKYDAEGNLTEPEATKASSTISLKIDAEYSSKWNFVVYGIGTSEKESGFVAKDGTQASDTKKADGKERYSSGYTIKKADGITPNPEFSEKYDANGNRIAVDPKSDDAGKVVPSPKALGDNEFLRMWTWNGKGKIVPGDTDGLSFYYTKVNPNTTNFELSANLHVNHWRIGNGQEGFGLLAADWIGADGDTSYHWTNSYTAVASKVDYKWDTVNDRWSTTDGDSVTLRIGIGSTAKTGVTAENMTVFENDVTTATTKYYKTQTLPLETSVHTSLYNNLIGNERLGSTNTWTNPIVDLRLSIKLDATGYSASYTPIDANGNVTGKTETIQYYDRNALSMVEENTAYIGFFATRFADVTFSNVVLDTRSYDPDEAKQTPPVEEVKLKASVSGAATANSEDYKLIYSANWKGTVTIEDEAGAVLAQEEIAPRDGDLTEEGKITIPVKLHIGTNKFKATYTPDKDYDPYNSNPPTILSSYDSKVETVTVTWKQYGKEGEILYVSPKGKPTGDGTKVNPLDVYTAVKYAQPGQTIYLIGGTYNLTKTIKIERGVNGTKDKMIYMLADPETCKGDVRPIFDFNSQCPAMVVAGDWWYLQGFDVTRSGNQMKGLQVSGNYNTLDGLNIYKNGSTGLQISRLLSSDKFEDWPSHNTILNCTSVLNADAGYTDADGFAAKLTVGNGNVFDGCISAYNADDGWDLFAKVWTGPIGIVTIQNSVSFENGQVIRDKDTHELVWFTESDNWEIVGSDDWEIIPPDSEDGEEETSYEIIEAGSGNGYKMGGSSITGYHTLKNSVAFRNRAKGIDSNSCNDIQAYNSITYDNTSYNIAMYSNASKTDFAANGVISYRKTVGMDNEDRIGLKDKSSASSIVKTQEDCVEKIFNNTNFFWNKLLHVSEPGSEYYNHYTTCTNEDTGKKQKPSITVADDWFVTLDYEKWEKDYCLNTPVRELARNSDGTVNLHGFLELSETGKAKMAAAGAKGGAGLGEGTISKDASDFEDKIPNGETSGSINTGGEKDNTSKNEDGIAADDFEQMPGNAEEVGIWCAIVDRDKIEYTGKALKPEVHVYSGNVRLKKGKDYTITYKNNLNAYVGAYDKSYYNRYSDIYSKYEDEDSALKLEEYEVLENGESKLKLTTYDALKNSYSKVEDKKKPTIIIKARGNYKNAVREVTQVYFDINPMTIKPDKDAMCRIGTSDIAIASKGSAQKVNPVVTFNNRKLSSAKEKDFGFEVYNTDEGGILTGSKLSEAKVSAKGLYKVKIEGKNNFAGKTLISLNVVDGSNKNVLASGFKLKNKIPDQEREGYNAVGPDEEIPLPVTLSSTDLVVVDKSGKTLTEVKKDANGKYIYTETTTDGNTVYTGQYTVSYKNNIDIGTATVIVTGVPGAGYYGSKEFKFRIVAPTLNKMLKDNAAKFIDTKDLATDKQDNGMLKITSSPKAFAANPSYQYEGKAVDLVNDYDLGLAVKRGSDWYLMVSGKDYKVSYRNNARQGNASAVFKGIGNYRGSITQKFQIKPFDLDAPANRFPQDGKAASKIGGTFEIKRISSKAGDGVGGSVDTYRGAVFKAEYTSSPTTYSGLEVTYSKGGVKPAVSLTINGNPLKAGRDYTVTYRNNTKPSDASTPANRKPTIIIKGKNGLKGTLTGTFTISKKDLDDKSDVIKVTAQDVKISKKTADGGVTGSYKTRIVVKDAKGKTLSAGSDYNKDIKYEIVDNATRRTIIKDITKDKTVTIPKSHTDEYLTIKATVYPKSDSKFYKGSSEGISTYYRVLNVKNSIRRSTFVINYAAARNDDTCFYEPTADNKAFYYYEDKINLNDKLLTVKLKIDGKEKKLAWGEDFEVVKYVGNDKQGTAKLTIQGKGKYFDTKVITFKIVPKTFKWWEKPVKPSTSDDSNKPEDTENSKKPEESTVDA